MATYCKDFLAQFDWVKPDAFIAASMGFRSSGVSLTEIPGERAFAWHCQTDGHKTISWGNVKEDDWRRDGCKATFHFTHLSYRDNFLLRAKEIFGDRFEFLEKSNNNPAKRASKAN